RGDRAVDCVGQRGEGRDAAQDHVADGGSGLRQQQSDAVGGGLGDQGAAVRVDLDGGQGRRVPLVVCVPIDRLASEGRRIERSSWINQGAAGGNGCDAIGENIRAGLQRGS